MNANIIKTFFASLLTIFIAAPAFAAIEKDEKKTKEDVKVQSLVKENRNAVNYRPIGNTYSQGQTQTGGQQIQQRKTSQAINSKWQQNPESGATNEK